MRRVKRGASARIRRQKILLLRKGTVGSNSRSFRIAKQQLIKSINFSYCGRRNRKRYFRSLWIVRLNRALKMYAISKRDAIKKVQLSTFSSCSNAGPEWKQLNYLTFIYNMRKRKCLLNRKVMAQIALLDPTFFKKLIEKIL
jgi:large subunit ribosomal protein L20